MLKKLLFKILNNEKIFEKEIISCSGENDEYLYRWKMFQNQDNWFGNIYVHNFKKPDVAIFHDHPWDFVSIVLSGGYTEYRPGEEPCRRKPGSIMFRTAEASHWVDHLEGDVWTLVIRGPRRRKWGFWTEKGWVYWREYLASHENSRAKVLISD